MVFVVWDLVYRLRLLAWVMMALLRSFFGDLDGLVVLWVLWVLGFGLIVEFVCILRVGCCIWLRDLAALVLVLWIGCGF